MKFIFALLILFSPLAQALELRKPVDPELYECRLLLVATGDVKNGEFSFVVARDGGAHGGQEFSFKEGGHEVSLIADGKWMGLRWMKGEKTIARSVFVVGAAGPVDHRVAILFDPEIEDNQVSLSCTRVGAAAR